ncbi:MAG: hypothetical protein ACP5RZ_02015 [Thermoplasmata archaeon]
MKSNELLGIISAALVIIISIIIFYSIYISVKSEFVSFVYIGIVSLIFSVASYLLHSVIKSWNVVTSFSLGYFVLFLMTTLYSTMIISYNIIYTALILFVLLIYIVLLYWRINALKSQKNLEKNFK